MAGLSESIKRASTKQPGEGFRLEIQVKHRAKEIRMIMHNNCGSVLRKEIAIHNPEKFKVRKNVTRKGRQVMEWMPMKKDIAYPFRWQEVSYCFSGYVLSVVVKPGSGK